MRTQLLILTQATLEALVRELVGREKGHRSYIRGRLKGLRKEDLMSLGKAARLCIDEVLKDQLVDMLVDYLVPDQGGSSMAERAWRLLHGFWRERASLESVRSKVDDACGDRRDFLEMLAWQRELSVERVEDWHRSREEVIYIEHL